MEEENNTKEKYDERKQEKEKERGVKANEQKQKNTARSLVRWIIFLVIVALLGWAGYARVQKELPQGEDLSVSFPNQGGQHIPFDEEFEYNSNPPSSGSHYERTAQAGFYDVTDLPIPDRALIHSLEHGDVWISYQPDIGDDIKDILKDFAAAKVVVTPRSENDTDIAIVAWRRVDAFNVDETEDIRVRIQSFITRFINRGPERIPATAGGHNTFNPATGI